MHYRISFIFVTFICLFCFAATGFTQNTNTDEDSKPVILYSGTPKKYEIADIKVEGVKNYEDYVLIGLSGLSVGQTITVPGDEITGAIKRYWKEHYTDYLYKPLYIAFKQWCICQNQEQKRIPEYEKCTVCFVHLYNRDLPLGRIRDHDNFEEKHVLDVISNFFLASDSGLHVDTYHITRMAEQDATEVYIMDTENFPKWLQKM